MPNETTTQQVEAVAPKFPAPVGASDAFMAALADAVSATTYTGDVPLVQKDALCGVPFLITGFDEHDGNGPQGYVNVRILLPNGDEACFNDGGSAIGPVIIAHAQAVGILDTDKGNHGIFPTPLYCRRGLNRSDYDTEINGATISATTYHLT